MSERSYNGRNLYSPNIDAATGDIALTGSGYLESNSAFGWYIIRNAAATSAEFDSAMTRTGRLTLKLSTTDVTGRLTARQVSGGGTLDAADIPKTIKVKPLTTYKLNVYVKTNNVASATIGVATYNPQLVRTQIPGTSINGTNDWTLKTVTFTTKVSDIYLLLDLSNTTAGNVSDMWVDVNSIELLEILPTRSTATSRTPASNRVAVRDMGTALRFGAGINDRINIANASSEVYDNESDVTICLRVRPDAFGDYYIFSIPATVGANRKYVSLTPTGRLNANLGAGGFGDILAGLKKGQWYQLILVCDHTNGRARAFVNGFEVKGWTNVTYGTGNANLVLGNVGMGKSFIGIADEYRIYGKLFTAEEAYNYNFNDIVPRDNLLGEWLFDEATGTTAIDTSGNGNDGAITGATYTLDVPLKLRTPV